MHQSEDTFRKIVPTCSSPTSFTKLTDMTTARERHDWKSCNSPFSQLLDRARLRASTYLSFLINTKNAIARLHSSCSPQHAEFTVFSFLLAYAYDFL
ncbi:hypothetical protein RB195_003723 [Necator americanus]|uniref:Uncharacterized protein n=1 Tax=Necator americanus TaxID=51031 RepID=A0ABR1DSJ8_NECAM